MNKTNFRFCLLSGSITLMIALLSKSITIAIGAWLICYFYSIYLEGLFKERN